MQIFVKQPTGERVSFEVEPSDLINDLKIKIEQKCCQCVESQRLIFKGQTLIDGTIESNQITKDSIIRLEIRLTGGACRASEPSPVIGLVKNDPNDITCPLPSGKLVPRFVRNTNTTGVYLQERSTCYAYAAASAYINTIRRIRGSRPPPSFEECVEVAKYNGNNGGNSARSIEILENHFHYGILCDVKNEVSIKDAMTLSVIISFSTSDNGWKHVANGELLWYPGGVEDGRHASYVDGYDLEKDCFIVKNSWGGEGASPRFNFSPSAAHDVYFIRVFFTLNSIKKYVKEPFQEKIQKCVTKLKNTDIDSAYMNEETATYSTTYCCHKIENCDDELNYLGYEFNQWIALNLKRKYEHPIYYYANKLNCS